MNPPPRPGETRRGTVLGEASTIAILVLTAHPEDLEAPLDELKRAGMQVELRSVNSEEEFASRLKDPDLAVILVDHDHPSGGLPALTLARKERPEVPFIFIADALLAEDAALDALHQGATDYVFRQRLGRLGPAVTRAVRESAAQERARHDATALQAMHDRLRFMVAHSPAVLYRLKRQRDKVVPVLVSENIEKMLGIPVSEAMRFEWWVESLHPDDRKRVLSAAGRPDRGDTHTMEYRLRHRDGSYRWIEDTNRIVRDSAGRPEESVGVWTDITARKLLEGEIARRDLQIDAFFSGATAGLALLDSRLRYVRINDTLAAMNGLPAKEHIGKTVREMLPRIAPAVEPLLHRVLDTGEPLSNVEIDGETPDRPGVRRYWMESFFPIPGYNGAPRGVGALIVEITDLKNAEAAARESEAQLRLALDASNIGPWDWNPRTNEVHYTRQWKRQIGYEEHEIANRYDEWESRLHPGDRTATLEALSAFLEGRAPDYAVEFRLRHKDGSYRWIYTRAEMVKADGRVQRLLGCHVDVTDRRLAEEERDSLKAQLAGRENQER